MSGSGGGPGERYARIGLLVALVSMILAAAAWLLPDPLGIGRGEGRGTRETPSRASETTRTIPGPPSTTAPSGGTDPPAVPPRSVPEKAVRFRVVYQSRTVRVPRAYCSPVYVDLDTPAVSPGGTPTDPELEYTDVECGLSGRPVLYPGRSLAISEGPTTGRPEGCIKALNERPGMASGKAPRQGLEWCIGTDQGRVVQAKVTKVDMDATMYLQVTAWETV
jgi:hypothetical protein